MYARAIVLAATAKQLCAAVSAMMDKLRERQCERFEERARQEDALARAKELSTANSGRPENPGN